ncbi:MAG TPA: ADP-ribosylglycohydrolase family protein [Chloroflexota bacterium]
MPDYPLTYTYGRALLRNELVQRAEEGAEPAPLQALRTEIESVSGDAMERDAFEEIYARILAVPVWAGWPYDEPSDLERIRARRPEGPRRLSPGRNLDDRVYAAWLGRAAGCVLGKPVEGWPRERITRYLRAVDAYPLSSYIPPPPQDMPDPGWRPSATESLLGHIDGVPRDDDLDYPILNLTVAEEHSTNITPPLIADAWLAHLPYEGIYTAERLAYRNLIDEYAPPASASRYNPYREWIGAQIRADLWGYICPGEPERAAALAWQDASVSHTANGIYGEMFVAALVAAALADVTLDEAIDVAVAEIPAQSRFAEMVHQVRGWADGHVDWEICRDRIEDVYGQYHWVHTLNNAAVVIMALACSGGNYSRGITIAVMGGWDTDCNGATVGSVLGALSGTSAISPEWAEPLHDTVRSFVIGHSTQRLSNLAARTRAVTRAAEGR